MLPIWIFWQGEQPALIDLCIRSIQKQNPSTRVISLADLPSLGMQDVWDSTEGLHPSFRSDLLRLHLVYEYGGVWMDADCVATAPLDFLPDIEKFDLICIRRAGEKYKIVATPFGAPQHSPLLKEAITRCTALIAKMKINKSSVPYSTTSVGILTDLSTRPNAKVLQHWRYNRIPASSADKDFLHRTHEFAHRLSTKFSPYVCTYHLTNVVYRNPKLPTTREELLQGDTFLSFLLRQGLCEHIYDKHSQEVASRIPPNSCGVEVGVWDGANAKAILSKNPTTRLGLVDTWADNLAFKLDPGMWQHIHSRMRAAVTNYGNRATEYRLPSVTAAQEFTDKTLDYVFIDADHSYASVMSDIKAWLPKIKIGGWIGGHDYCRGHAGVIKAVDELFPNAEIAQGHTWFSPV